MWKMFLLPYLSISVWQGPIWVSSVGGVVRCDLGNFLYILLKLFYIEAWHAILPFAISIHLLSPERKILQTGCCLALGFKFIEYENECMTWVLSSKSSAERQLASEQEPEKAISDPLHSVCHQELLNKCLYNCEKGNNFNWEDGNSWHSLRGGI